VKGWSLSDAAFDETTASDGGKKRKKSTQDDVIKGLQGLFGK
jgi:hypothetical protein